MNRNSPEVTRRVFLARAGTAVAVPFLAACGLLSSPEGKPWAEEQARKIAEALVAKKYQLEETFVAYQDANEAYTFILFSTEGADDPLVIGVRSTHETGQWIEHEMNISGGLYQPDAKDVIVKTESLGEMIPADKLAQVAQRILDLNGFGVEEMRLAELAGKYSWGGIDVVNFFGKTNGGRKFSGHFDAKGQGTIRIAS